MNSKIFELEEAESYYERNKNNKNQFIAEHILSLFPKKILAGFDIAEFGMGTGANLFLLSNYTNQFHGYDVSQRAIKNSHRLFSGLPRDKYYLKRVNLCQKFLAPIKYDLVIFGWLTYYISDDELVIVKNNLLNCLKRNGYLFVNDFIMRDCREKTDKRNNRLIVFKRILSFWNEYLKEFDLIHFRLFDCNRYFDHKTTDNIQLIDTRLSDNDEDWIFNALFRLR